MPCILPQPKITYLAAKDRQNSPIKVLWHKSYPHGGPVHTQQITMTDIIMPLYGTRTIKLNTKNEWVLSKMPK